MNHFLIKRICTAKMLYQSTWSKRGNSNHGKKSVAMNMKMKIE